MDEGTQGLYVLGAMAITFSIFWHAFEKRYKRAIIGATITTVILFQAAAAIHIGNIDPFILVAMVTTGVLTAIIATIIGLPFKLHRRDHQKSKAKNPTSRPM